MHQINYSEYSLPSYSDIPIYLSYDFCHSLHSFKFVLSHYNTLFLCYYLIQKEQKKQKNSIYLHSVTINKSALSKKDSIPLNMKEKKLYLCTLSQKRLFGKVFF